MYQIYKVNKLENKIILFSKLVQPKKNPHYFHVNLDLTLASLSLAFSARFSYLLGCLVNAVVLLEFVAIMGVEVFFICKLRPSPFELFHSEIAMRLYKICDK